MTVKRCAKCQEETAHFNGECAQCGTDAKTSAAIARDYCSGCHISFGLAEPRIAVGDGKVMHEDCFTKFVFARVRVHSHHVH